MEQKLTKFEEKIVNFLTSHYKQRLVEGKLLVREIKRLSKSKNDITTKIKNSLNGFLTLSEIIRISNITPDKTSTSYDSKNKEYVREIYSYLPRDIISSTLNFNLVGELDNLEYFKNIQRELSVDIFSLDMMEKILESIFVFHPVGIVSNDIICHNPQEVNSEYYQEDHKLYYHDMASILVTSGINEIKKNLHPDRDRLLIERLDFTVNIIRKLDYRVEKIT